MISYQLGYASKNNWRSATFYRWLVLILSSSSGTNLSGMEVNRPHGSNRLPLDGCYLFIQRWHDADCPRAWNGEGILWRLIIESVLYWTLAPRVMPNTKCCDTKNLKPFQTFLFFQVAGGDKFFCDSLYIIYRLYGTCHRS